MQHFPAGRRQNAAFPADRTQNAAFEAVRMPNAAFPSWPESERSISQSTRLTMEYFSADRTQNAAVSSFADISSVAADGISSVAADMSSAA